MKSFKKTVDGINFEVFPHSVGSGLVECDVWTVKHPERKIFKGYRYKTTQTFMYEYHESITKMCERAISIYSACVKKEEKISKMWKEFKETP